MLLLKLYSIIALFDVEIADTHPGINGVVKIDADISIVHDKHRFKRYVVACLVFVYFHITIVV